MRAPRKSRSFRTMIILGICISSLLYLYSGFTTNASKHLPGIPAADLPTFASNAINNTVVIVSINKGMLHWADNLLCSLSRQTSFNTSKIVFWALDEGAETALKRRGHATYRDPSLFSTSNNENYRGDTKAYKRMMRERPKFFINVLRAGYDILMLDADTVWWQSPLSIVPSQSGADRELTADADIVFSTDARDFYQNQNAFQDVRRRGSLMPPVCNGIFWMKSSPATISLWSEMLDRFLTPAPLGWYRRWHFQDDQRGMDVLLNDGRAKVVEPLPRGLTPDLLPKYRRDDDAPGRKILRVRLLDQTLVVNGYLLQNRRETYESNLLDVRAKGGDRMAAHFNWKTTQVTKEKGARELGMYYLDEQGSCRL